MDVTKEITQILISFGEKALNAFSLVIGAIIILIIGWIIAKIVSTIITRVLKLVNADLLAEKLKSVDIFANLDFKITKVLGKLVYWGIMLFFTVVATDYMQYHTVSQGILDLLFVHIPRILSAVLFFFIGTLLANFIRQFIDTTASSVGIGTGKILSTFVFYFLLVMIAITSLNQVGIDTEIITENIQIILGGGILALGVGYGLGSRSLMSNLLGAFYSRGKFSAGQKIRVNGIEGIIIKVDNTSILIQAEGKKVVIPLSKLMETEVEILD